MLCPNCKREIPDGSLYCNYCGYNLAPGPEINQAPKKEWNLKWRYLIILVVVLALGSAIWNKLNTPYDTDTTSARQAETQYYTQEPEQTLTNEKLAELTAQEKADYISICNELDYKEVSRDPDYYEDMNAHFRGRVNQAIEGDIDVYMVFVSQDEYGIWDDLLYVKYVMPDGAPRILEDDIIDIYGMMGGLTTYTTVLGVQKTVPVISVLYID